MPLLRLFTIWRVKNIPIIIFLAVTYFSSTSSQYMKRLVNLHKYIQSGIWNRLKVAQEIFQTIML